MSEQNFSQLLSVFFRISDSPTPDKCCQREVCFLNFLSVFRGLPITVVADNCGPQTLAFVRQPGVTVVETNLGNSGSFLHTLDLACKADTMFAYFSEDDYIHRQESARLIIEGLRWSNYVTLYDHPDKYIKERGYGEVGRCLKTETWHWRQTISTCNTFGANLGLLRQDMDVFRKHAVQGKVPNDHATWCELAQKKRSLTAAIPGAAFNTHRVAEHGGFDWGLTWAVEQIKRVGEMVKQHSLFAPPPENVEFAPVDIPPVQQTGLPKLASIGKTTQVPVPAEAPPTESKIRKKTPGVKPPLAIPNVAAFHADNVKRKPFEVEEGQFGAFIPL